MKTIKNIRNPDIIAQESGNETMLYSPESEVMLILNPTAKRIWDLCDGEHTPADIVQTLQASFANSPESDISADVEETLRLFSEHGLLQEPT